MTDENYLFQLRFGLPKGQRLEIEESEIQCKVSGNHSWFLRSRGDKKICEEPVLTFVSDPYRAYEEAVNDARKLRNALLVTGIRLLDGIACEDVIQFIDVTSYQVSEDGVVYMPEVEHLDELNTIIYEREIPKRMSMQDERLIGMLPKSWFFGLLTTSFNKLPELSDKQQLALDLCSLAHFETSTSASFISYTTAMEVLSEQVKRDKPQVDFIKALIKQIAESELDEKVSHSLRSELGRLKKVSITEACIALIRRTLGNERVETFRELYNFRSQLVHNGCVESGIDLQGELHTLNKIVVGVLIRDLFGTDIFEEIFDEQ